MSSRRSSSNLPITYSSPRTSSSSVSSQSSSGRSSAYNNYYYYTSTGGAMGRAEYSGSASRRPVEETRRVADPNSKNYVPIRAQEPLLTLSSSAARADTITVIRRGSVSVVNHDKRRADEYEPRASEARSSDHHKSNSKRYPKK
jgi:hypothetical protein